MKIAIVTPESAPLAIFGPAASEAVSELLKARGIHVFTGSRVREIDEGGITLTPGDRVLGPAEAIALPVMEGPAIDGLPADEQGFIPVDEHGRVKGVEDVYAAGDGTNFPIKQGGLGTQQADAAAEHIAHRLGASETPEPFRPLLRGKLLTGDESLSLSTDVAGGGGAGVASLTTCGGRPTRSAPATWRPCCTTATSMANPSRPGVPSTSRSPCRRSGTRSRWRSTRTSPRRSTELDAEHGAQGKPCPIHRTRTFEEHPLPVRKCRCTDRATGSYKRESVDGRKRSGRSRRQFCVKLGHH